ncbi:hypothetical protein D0Z07_0980 [Hyphodiscus hymeniophilus]|uniref:Heterokaryon incompatibility domain-containing protein n=1 Tax=Hyphodiscus hymeniophilus TaxID=353542 RepID=A0A9P7B0F4_9HELO|nr:hypothetical protein D0Z07_0980 [Hyphodiscus hymeniophilus]
MEHLPPVAKPYDPISVPFIAEEYDGGLFEDYPARRGLDLARLTKGDFQNLSLDQVGSFLQTWLFFGLLHGVLGVNFKTSEFVRIDKDGKKWLTTARLPFYLYGFYQYVKNEKERPDYTEEYVKVRNARIYPCLNLSQEVWAEFDRLPSRYNIPNPLSPEMAFSIHILAISLQVGATEICGGSPGEPTYRIVPWEKARHWRITRNNFIDQRMVSQVVRQIWTHENPIGQYYASLLGPPSRKLDHGDCDFDEKECAAMKKLPLSQVRHDSEDCQCATLLVDRAKLADIIQRDEIAVLRLIEQNGNPTLEVVSMNSEPDLEYTAMSHVWSDGWGNPMENSLPLCRVQKLIRDISATYSMPDFDVEPPQGKYHRKTKHDDRVFFWMDTLCVPRTPDHIYSRASSFTLIIPPGRPVLLTSSVIQMRDVYESAERVLVYDAELMSSTSQATYEELNMRVSCSRWIRRLWTVQEAVLAKRLIYQFADGPRMFMTGSLMWKARNKDLALNYFNSVGWDCTTQLEDYNQRTASRLLIFVWMSLLSNRSVSVESDEAICFCILMDFDLKKLMGTHESLRIQFLWTLLGDTVPLGVLFVPGPRLTAKSFSWAPASFLNCTKIGPTMNHLCSVTGDGLCAKIGPNAAFEGKKYFIKKSPVKTNPEWGGLDLHLRTDLVVILESPYVAH